MRDQAFVASRRVVTWLEGYSLGRSSAGGMYEVAATAGSAPVPALGYESPV